MAGPVCTKIYAAPPYNTAEILRYAGARSASPEVQRLLEACCQEAWDTLSYAVCWKEIALTDTEGQQLLNQTPSQDLRRRLHGCDRAILFGATVGIGLDRLIARYGRVSPAKALLFQAIGAERIEALCDLFCEDISREQAALGRRATRRFSPGYGDLPLELQKDLFALLDCPRKIGLTLNKSLLMSPSKSVTSLVCLSAEAESCPDPSGCAACQNKNCIYRRTP